MLKRDLLRRQRHQTRAIAKMRARNGKKKRKSAKTERRNKFQAVATMTSLLKLQLKRWTSRKSPASWELLQGPRLSLFLLSSLQNLRQNKRNLCLNLGLAPNQWNKPRIIRIPLMEEMTGPVAGVSSQMLHHLYKLLLLPKNHSSLQRTAKLQVFLTR